MTIGNCRLAIGGWRSLLIVAAVAATIAQARADVIDRTMAVVFSQPILLSDVNAALVFQLVQLPAGAKDSFAAALDRVIERTLMLAEVDRYQPPEPAPQEIESRAAEIERRFDPAVLEKMFAATGMSRDRLRQYIRDDLRIATYLNQRFGVAAQPSDDEVLAYYREHAREFMRDGVQQPFEAVAETIRARLVQERRMALIADWLATLRRRADVTMLYQSK